MRNKEGYVQYYEYVVGLISSNNNERRNAQRNATYREVISSVIATQARRKCNYIFSREYLGTCTCSGGISYRAFGYRPSALASQRQTRPLAHP